MKRENLAAVVTTQFMTDSTELAVRSLRALARLPIRHIIIVTDEKEPNGPRLAKLALEQMQDALRSQGMTGEVLPVNAYSTARRWWPGLCRAFADGTILGAINFPGDLRDDISDAQVARFKEALENATPDEMILFDYDSPTDAYKHGFDQLFLFPLLRIVHPKLVPALQKLGHGKLRTEFFCLGRKPFENKWRNFGRSWGTDPTVQLVLSAVEQQIPVRSVHVGTVKDDGNTRSSATGQVQQITRMGHQLLTDAIIAGRADKKTATIEELDRLCAAVYEEIQRGVCRSGMLDRAIANPNPVAIDRRIMIATHIVGGSARSRDGSSTLKRAAETVKLLGGRPGANISLLFLMQPASDACFDQRERERQAQLWESEAKRLNETKEYPEIELVFEMDYVPYEPATLAWRTLQRRAFHSAQPAEAMLYYDINFIRWPQEHLRLFKPGFQQMLSSLQQGADLVLGDYNPVVPIDDPGKGPDVEVKRCIEIAVKAMLEEAFPELFKNCEMFRALERPRTEFHGLSFRLHQHLGNLPYAPYDYGLFMLVAARLCGLKIDRIMLGDLPETTTNPAAKIVEQLARVRFEIDAMRHYRPLLGAVHPKLLVYGLEAKFAPFKGYSFLFDNPRETYADRNGLLYVRCAGHGNPDFYQRLFGSLTAIDLPNLRKRWSLCPLDPESAHCTALDGHSPDNLKDVETGYQDRIGKFIEELPGSLLKAATLLPEFHTARLAREPWAIDFVFDQLAIFPGGALVAKLKPADEDSAKRLKEMKTARSELAGSAPHLGLRDKEFTPHISLAYFADPQMGERAKLQLAYWTSVFQAQLNGHKLSFRTISLHGFTDMVSFFKMP